MPAFVPNRLLQGRSSLCAVALLTMIAVGCNDTSFFVDKGDPAPAPEPASVQGRVCDPSGRTWLADALVYVHLFDAGGTLYETREAYSDRDGYWTIDNLPPDNEYTFYVQAGDVILEQRTVYVGDGDFVQLDEPECFDPLQVDVAIVAGDYDNFDTVLSSMGFANFFLVDGTNPTELTDFLSDTAAMSQYDIIFFNGGHQEEDVIYDTDASDTAGVHSTVVQNIRDYVSAGGSVYASDWAYDVIEQGWPDRMTWVGDDTIPNDAQMGEYTTVSATVKDEAMADWLGSSTISVQYDLPVWPPIASAAESVTTHLEANVSYRQGTESYNLAQVPVLVSFTSGEGRVVFSTFRVARNGSDDMLLILQYMMYSL
jgi:hypothetical protein